MGGRAIERGALAGAVCRLGPGQGRGSFLPLSSTGNARPPSLARDTSGMSLPFAPSISANNPGISRARCHAAGPTHSMPTRRMFAAAGSSAKRAASRRAWPDVGLRQATTKCLKTKGRSSRITPAALFGETRWCGGEDSNFHGLPHSDLNAARLPIPPPPRQGERRRGPSPQGGLHVTPRWHDLKGSGRITRPCGRAFQRNLAGA